MNLLFETQQIILNQFLSRDFYPRDLMQKITLDNHITGIFGGRGVGKTTLLLKLALTHGAHEGQALYASADHMYFLDHNLLDLVDQLYKETDVRLICIDEIHKQEHWQRLLKNTADIYPDMKIVFTSSSRIDLIHSQYDLSRRVTLHELPGLSFREYLAFFHQIKLSIENLETLLNSNLDIKISQEVPQILKFFKTYLKNGYYPFSRNFTQDFDFFQALNHTVQKTIYEDIATLHALKTPTLLILEKLYRYTLTLTPGQLSVNKLANALNKDFSDISDYLKILEQAGLIRFLFSSQTGKAALRNPNKIFPENSNLIYANLSGNSDLDALGMIRETFALSHLQAAKIHTTYPKQGDLELQKDTQSYILEIGGKNKTTEQIDSLPNGFVFKEGILTGRGKTRPLYLLGFLY